MSKKLVVAIDGPAGSGKSTSAKLVAQKLGYLYIDTGAMYRALTFWAIKNNKIDDPESITELAENAVIVLNFIDGNTHVTFNGEKVTPYIRSSEVNSKVSDVSKIESVRKVLVEKQRKMADINGGVVMEGRDIGTVVFPDADVKIFLTASIEQRAFRRQKEYEENGIHVSLDDIKENLIKRDKIDSTREVSPLIKAPDSIEVNTSEVSIEKQVDIIMKNVREAAQRKGIEVPA